jgi:hypothetical protein
MSRRASKADSRNGREGKLTTQQRKALKEAVEGQLDDLMRRLGCPDPASYTDEDGWRSFPAGSTHAVAFVTEAESELYLHVAAHVMPLPSDRELILPLMRELLELNVTIAGSARFGVRNNGVFVAITEPVDHLDAGAVDHYVGSVATLADGVDEKLIEKYGGTRKERKAPAHV